MQFCFLNRYFSFKYGSQLKKVAKKSILLAISNNTSLKSDFPSIMYYGINISLKLSNSAVFKNLNAVVKNTYLPNREWPSGLRC